MKNQFPKRSLSIYLFLCLTGLLIALLGLAFIGSAQPVQASLSAQNQATLTPTITVTATSTGPTATSTQVGTLPAPAVTGTPTALIPVTGADLTQQGGGGNTGLWIGIWLLGLLLVGFGLISRLSRREQ